MAIDNTIAAFYATMFCAAALSSLGRSLREGDFLSISNLAGSVLCGGFLAVACAGLLLAATSANWTNSFGYCLFTSIVCGLAGKKGDEVVNRGIDAVLGLLNKLFGKDDQKPKGPG